MINKISASVAEALNGVRDGATVLIGGFGTAGIPGELIDGLIEQGARELTVVNNNAGNGDTGLAALLKAGRVRKVICSFPRQVDSQVFDALYRSGQLELELVPQGNLAERLRAAGAGIGAFFTPTGFGTELARNADGSNAASGDSAARQGFRKKLREGELNDKEIELELAQPAPTMEIMSPPGMEDMAEQLKGMLGNMGAGRRKMRRVKIAEAMKLLTDEEAGKLVNEDEIRVQALHNLEQNGIVFIDEIDKVASRSLEGGSTAEVSRQGVQRDLLPLVEGTSVTTKYGIVRTDHILFIASGAFHLSRPSDLIPELQGRLPIRVELSSLSVQDFEAILTQTDASLVRQYQALMATEGVTLDFAADGIARLAEIAFAVNESTENIGARRLSTIMERLLEELSFGATRHEGETVRIDAAYVNERLSALSQDEDLSRYIL